jgi:hypothetical protein
LVAVVVGFNLCCCFGIVAGIIGLWWLPLWGAVVVALAVAIFLVALWAIWWWLPKQQADRLTSADEKAKVDVEDNFRKTISQVLAGAAVIIGAFLTYWATMQTLQENRKQFEATVSQNREQFEQTARHSREQFEATVRQNNLQLLATEKQALTCH